MPELIRSLQNPRVKSLVRLRTGNHRKRQGRFLIEGFREIKRAMQCDWPIESLFFCEDLFKHPDSFELVHACEENEVEVVQMTAAPFSKCAYRQGSDGLLATALQQNCDPDKLHLGDCPLVVVAESVEKPGNLGAIMRTADAAGADALLIVDGVTDPYNPNCIRASQGAVFSLPFVCADAERAIHFLKEGKLQIVTTSPHASINLWQVDFSRPTALVFGSEDTGLSEKWWEIGTSCKLPMKGITDSLNVSATVSVALFEAVRQRFNSSA